MHQLPTTRLTALDGLRTLAILMVISFHYFANPSQFQSVQMLYPFGLRYADYPLLKHGYLGVDLFFMISGFVIAMTLESTHDWIDFTIKRIARLYPPMLLCTLISFIGLGLLPQRVWLLNPVDLLPGLTFIDEMTWREWLGPHVRIVEIVYWTLFVEVKFYILAASAYYIFRRLPLIFSLGLIFNIVWIATRFMSSPEAIEFLKIITTYHKLPWFLAGVAFWGLHSRKHVFVSAMLTLQMAIVLLIRTQKDGNTEAAIIFSFFVIFFATIYLPKYVKIFSWRPLVLIGASSYPIYLLHNRLGISITHAIAPLAPPWLEKSAVIPMLVAGSIIGFAVLIHRFWEVPAQRKTIRALTSLRSFVGAKISSMHPS